MSARFLIALVASAAVVLTAPVIGQVTIAVRTALPGRFAFVVYGALAAVVAAAIGVAVLRVRERRARRLLAMATSVAIVVAYAAATASGTPDQDAVERLHFVEFGVIAWLFYRASDRLGPANRIAAAVLCGVLVGVADEWTQWFVPIRIGEFRDILIDAVAAGAGVLFSLGVEPPATSSGRQASHAVALLAAATVVAVAIFVDCVHLAYEVDAGAAGRFRSHYDAADLRSIQQERREQWRDHPPIAVRRYSREDRYLAEAVWHIVRRDGASAAGNAFVAWHENLILEAFYDPMLDTPSYAIRVRKRWTEAQREEARRAAAGRPEPFVSDAERLPLLTWSRAWFWSGAVVLAVGVFMALRPRGGDRQASADR